MEDLEQGDIYTPDDFDKNFKEKLLNDYEIVRILGSGSIGQVYLAKSKHTQKLRAIKILHPNLEYDFVCQ